jgi:secreted PhoX family phosphatase
MKSFSKRVLAYGALGLGVFSAGCAQETSPKLEVAQIVKVEFTHTPTPQSIEAMSTAYTQSQVRYFLKDGSVKTVPLEYHTLFSVTEKVGDALHPAGQLYNQQGQPLSDHRGLPLIAETPDANSVLVVDGKPFLVTHYEYDWILSDKTPVRKNPDWPYPRIPMSMTLTHLDQSADGRLKAVRQSPIDFSSVDGLWIPCFGSQTPWNTHLGSEEDYDMQYNPLTQSFKKTRDAVKSMSDLYFEGQKQANPYHYGYFPEVTVKGDGSTQVVKHYAMGRGTWEVAKIMPDERTAYYGDDGTHVALFMFVADRARDLSSGRLYAARFTQTSSPEDFAGAGDLQWIELGHATNAQVKAWADAETFESLFINAPLTDEGFCPAGLQRVRAGSEADECLAVRAGKERPAAFLESRRMAALKGATTEWNKMEGVALNAKDRKAYVAISFQEKGMQADQVSDPALADHIQFPAIKAGATFEMTLAANQVTREGQAIDSPWVATRISAIEALLGKDIPVDAQGNRAAVERVANTDNLFFSEKMRVLFVGEDSGLHVNNYLWAYHVDTGALSRILSVPSGAEVTGLQVVENLQGHAYIMSNYQHPGDFIKTLDPLLKAKLTELIHPFEAKVGYLGGMIGLD